jgi:hypothetical protein
MSFMRSFSLRSVQFFLAWNGIITPLAQELETGIETA